ncbi:MAG: tol-pal system protein YbgF [Desulfobacterales bacterium S5133MH4]|nr:MAG: tol-pal system protein YbgF [Desulfobacterales bacterium S5133MH4]
MDMKIATAWIVMLAILVLAGGGCALQEDLVAVNNRVTAMDQRLSRQYKQVEADRTALKSKVGLFQEKQEKSDVAYRSKDADLHALLKDLREEIQQLRGQIDEGRYEARQRISSLTESEARQKERWENLEKRLKSDFDRIVRLEQYLGLEPSEKSFASKPQKAGPDKEKKGAKKTPDKLYAVAKQQFDRGEYDSARELFQAFVKKYPKSKNADNAQFWIGEVYYDEKWYEQAILEYEKVIDKYPNGNKVQSALLKQGFAFHQLGDTANAKLILRELVHKYPNSNEAKIAEKKLKTIE